MAKQKVSGHLRSVPGRKQRVRVKPYERKTRRKTMATAKPKRKSGQIYHETRKNRSDIRGSRV
jgi:hypothetical protein